MTAATPNGPITYLAERGMLAQTPQGARLIMLDGTVEQSARGGRQLSVLKFQRDVFDLDQFAGPARANQRQTSERFLGELLNPDRTVADRARSAMPIWPKRITACRSRFIAWPSP